MNNAEIINDISSIVDYLGKLIDLLKRYDNNTREQDVAIQKLEEAVFWLTYGIEGEDE